LKSHAQEKIKFLVFAVLIVGMLVLSFYFDLHEKISVEGIKEFILGMGAWAPFVYALIYVVIL